MNLKNKNIKKKFVIRTIDLFRAGAKIIIKAMPVTQKSIAVKLNKSHAAPQTAASDLCDFLGGRKTYSLPKQERLADILGDSHFEIQKMGYNLLEKSGKVKNFKQIRERKIMLASGTSCSLATILKMAEDFLLYDNKTLQIQKSSLINSIIDYWKTVQSLKIQRKKIFKIINKENK